MDIDIEVLQEAVEMLDAYLYDDEKLSDKKLEKLKDVLNDIIEQADEE